MSSFIQPSSATIDPPRLTLASAPASEPFTSSDAIVQQFMRVSSGMADATMIDLCIAAARAHFERVTGLALITQSWTLSFDFQGAMGVDLAPIMQANGGFLFAGAAGREITLARAPLQSITHVKYLDADGTLQTWASTNYTAGNVGVDTAPGRLWLNDGCAWPTVGAFPGALQITFACGYGASATSIPASARMAVLQLASHWYEHRLPVQVGNIVQDFPHHLEALVAQHRLSWTV